jgi:hypothetical protein
MRKLHSAILSSGIVLALAASGAQAKPWKTFDVPNATVVTPTAYTAGNTIFGYYLNSDSTTWSFIRTSDGTVTPFNLSDGGSTELLSANTSGDTAGTVFASGGSQAFLRTADGNATLFGINGSSATEAKGMNDNDWIVGDYVDPSTSKQMAFIKRPNGKIETFAAPDGSNSITATAINNSYTVIGTYGSHGYFRDVNGNMTTFRITSTSLVPVAVNNSGAITGYYVDTNGNTHGFVRSAAGNTSGFNAPNSGHGTFVTGMNDVGIIVGWCKDANNIPHGFALNTADTKFAALNAPDGVDGTQILAIDKTSKMIGLYFDADNTAHPVRANKGVTGF